MGHHRQIVSNARTREWAGGSLSEAGEHLFEREGRKEREGRRRARWRSAIRWSMAATSS